MTTATTQYGGFTDPTILCDFYKVSHREQYPNKTETVFSTWTPRMSRLEGVDQVVAFGIQGFVLKYLVNYFESNFFQKPKEDVVAYYKRFIKHTLGVENPSADHLEELHKLGYLPIKICAVKEGTLVPLRTPMMTIENTDPRFFWVTNYLETLMSCELWLPSTSATIALEYKKILIKYAELTGGDKGFVPFQAHDFSMRGMGSREAAELSGAAHLTSFVGTDTMPAIAYLEQYYYANIEKELVGTSIPATEHSVMCAHGPEKEYETYKHLITNVYPKGFVSIVSDTWDFWKVLDEIVRGLKPEILARDGKVVIRPDSGDPVKIICGDPEGETEFERKGAVEVLWDIFGGTVTDKGYRVLDPHIGLIYGDSITLGRCEEICRQLMEKGFASTNVVYGVGSFTYQYNTRDTFGFALKSTYVVVDGKERKIFKDPKTDSGMKKSQKGLVVGIKTPYGISYIDDLNREEYDNREDINIFEVVYENGQLLRRESIAEIRARLEQ